MQQSCDTSRVHCSVLTRKRFREENERKLLEDQDWRLALVREREQMQQAQLRRLVHPLATKQAVNMIALRVRRMWAGVNHCQRCGLTECVCGHCWVQRNQRRAEYMEKRLRFEEFARFYKRVIITPASTEDDQWLLDDVRVLEVEPLQDFSDVYPDGWADTYAKLDLALRKKQTPAVRGLVVLWWL